MQGRELASLALVHGLHQNEFSLLLEFALLLCQQLDFLLDPLIVLLLDLAHKLSLLPRPLNLLQHFALDLLELANSVLDQYPICLQLFVPYVQLGAVALGTAYRFLPRLRQEAIRMN